MSPGSPFHTIKEFSIKEFSWNRCHEKPANRIYFRERSFPFLLNSAKEACFFITNQKYSPSPPMPALTRGYLRAMLAGEAPPRNEEEFM